MNIQQAKEQIRNAVIAYRTRDAYGRLRIPAERQRPVFLVGAPGIGKTAIVRQVAREMGIGFVNYSITHHTRQSALGLPFITDREFDGKHYRMSEYTMSEIIAAVYHEMETTGLREGILFLDEINCVSETLAPAMLQFLQFKVFGQHQVPEGWIVVTAGNPPEYNRAVREFDMVTQDRLKRVDIEPDYEVWRNWAEEEGVHAAVLGYLDVRKEDFYRVKNTVEGMSFVTPRGWVDLSDMLKLYEFNDLTVDQLLIRQYLQNDRITRQFAVYYELWKKYEQEYRVEDILAGSWTDADLERARAAAFDERISLIGLLLDGARNRVRQTLDHRNMLVALKSLLKKVTEADSKDAWENSLRELELEWQGRRKNMTEEQQVTNAMVREWMKLQKDTQEDALRESFAGERHLLSEEAQKAGQGLDHLFAFAEAAFGTGPEIAMILTALTASKTFAGFISRYGCKSYYRFHKELMFYERKMEILQKLEDEETDEEQTADEPPARG